MNIDDSELTFRTFRFFCFGFSNVNNYVNFDLKDNYDCCNISLNINDE